MQECCFHLVQVTTAAMSSWVQWPCPEDSLPKPCPLHSFCPLLPHDPWVLGWGGDIDVWFSVLWVLNASSFLVSLKPEANWPCSGLGLGPPGVVGDHIKPQRTTHSSLSPGCWPLDDTLYLRCISVKNWCIFEWTEWGIIFLPRSEWEDEKLILWLSS